MKTKISKIWFWAILAATAAAFLPQRSLAENNLHLIEANSATGFAIYRSGAPDRQDMREMCRLGIEEMMVLSGNADDHEYKYQRACPTLKVIYNKKQSTKKALDEDFLKFFDQWVTDAQLQGKKIAFRCSCGCHRTGRLAGYYQIKYQKLSLQDARILMRSHGKWMFFYPHIFDQLRAIDDYVNGRPCSVERKNCIQPGRSGFLAKDNF